MQLRPPSDLGDLIETVEGDKCAQFGTLVFFPSTDTLVP
jgi:hypothetical protein